MKQFPYLVVQALLTSIYFAFRFTLTDANDIASLKDLEFKSMGVLGLLMIIRLIRLESWLGYFVFAIKMSHIIMCGLMFQYNYMWAMCFGLIAILIHFGIEPPFFEVTSRVAQLNDQLVRQYIEYVPECFLLFYTTWEDRCIAVTPVFMSISEKYSTNDRFFARIDVGRYKDIEKDFNVSATNGTLKQIPTIIHFKNGKEVKRINPAILGEKLMNYPNIVKYFNLKVPPKVSNKKA